jgi:hypothetical protein
VLVLSVISQVFEQVEVLILVLTISRIQRDLRSP